MNSLVLVLFVASPFMAMAQQQDLYIMQDPHIKSVNKGYELCNFDSATWFSCLSSPFLQIDCKFNKIYSSSYQVPTFLSKIFLKFDSPNSKHSETYSVFDANAFLKNTLDSGSSFLFDDAGYAWLYIYQIDNSFVVIQDLNTLTTISITQNWGQSFGALLNLFITTDQATTTFASGLLVSGCPNGYGYPEPWATAGRRKRATASDCQNLPGSSYSTLNSTVVSSICQNDIRYNPQVVENLKTSVKQFDIHMDYHKKVILSNSNVGIRKQ